MNMCKSRAGAARRFKGPVNVALVSLVVFLVPAGARADVIGGWFGNIAQRTDGGIVAGNSFNTAPFGTQTINSLGFIDVGSDGISGSYQVGLWDSSMNLLRSTTVTPGAQLINGFRYAPITPLTLPTGATFTIGALIPATPGDPWLEADAVVLGVGYTGQGLGQFQPSGTLVFPGTLDDRVYVVANASDAIVPEPGALSLLIGVALLAHRARRRRA